MERRQFLATVGALAAAPAFPSAAEAPFVVAHTRQGRVQGLEVEGVRTFKGVPYARPPLGPLRFRPAAPPLSWSGPRPALSFGNAPIQPDPSFGPPALEYLGAPRSEDCLYLNVWAPASPGPHPVMVWIHGGGNEGGSASMPNADGAHFARSGIVCVTVGYRTGVAGFLELGDLLGPAFRESGVNGLRDIVAALRWVRANIAGFGGDPARVTLAGESAGAKNVLSIASSPEATGLVSRIIVESGAETVHQWAEAERVAAIARASLAAVKMEPPDLLTAPPASLLALQARIAAGFDRPFPFRAVVGGRFLPHAPGQVIAAGGLDRIAMLIGSNRDESIVFLDRARVGKPLAQKELTNVTVERGEQLFARYGAAYPELSPLARRVRFLSAEEYRKSTTDLARAHAARRRAPTYLYSFERRIAGGPFMGWVPHTAELPYVWNSLGDRGTVAFFGPPSPEAQQLADELHGRWAAFVHGSAPDLAGHAAWPALDQGSLLMRFDRTGAPAPLDLVEDRLWQE